MGNCNRQRLGFWLVCGVAMVSWMGLQSIAAATTIPTANLKVWLEAGTGYTKDGSDFISNWADQWGSSDDAAQATSGRQPKWINNALNGYPVVQFDNSNDYLSNFSYSHGSNDMTAVVVVKRNGAPSGYRNILITGASNNTTVANFVQIYGTAGGSSTLTGNFPTNTLDISGPLFSTTAYQLVVLRKSNAATGVSNLWVDGTLAGSGTGNQTLNGGYLLGDFNNGNTLNGNIAEVLIYNAALSTSDRQLAEGVLAWKFALQGNLPSNHPWKNVNPVPEPGSFAMLLAGTMMLWFFRGTSRRFR